ncbi:hypothetical protein BXZ70DRAFT_1011188 [Cristinia sonorae]|uniref:Zn(2)-C6 fungal-type domain-containing protein n=1 Tax=Cristinia sonorae TaxID=1940300 RepID=A0A8K0XLN4_9AGAR|nr:hypothetical protein BXZ70DRAFT_1011188 [Cristinia sonorae]
MNYDNGGVFSSQFVLYEPNMDSPRLAQSYHPLDLPLPTSEYTSGPVSYNPPPFRLSDYIHEDVPLDDHPAHHYYPTSDHYQIHSRPFELPRFPDAPQVLHPVSPILLPPAAPNIRVPVDVAAYPFEPVGTRQFEADTVRNAVLHTTPSRAVAQAAIPPRSHPSNSWCVAQQPPTDTATPGQVWSMSGSLDPVTGVFQQTPEHRRMRTRQACEPCRHRKAKCTGEATCARCAKLNLPCVYKDGKNEAGEAKKHLADKQKKRRDSSASSSLGKRRATEDTSPPDTQRAASPKRLKRTATKEDMSCSDTPPSHYSPENSTQGNTDISGSSSPAASPPNSSSTPESDGSPPTLGRLRTVRPGRLDLTDTPMFAVTPVADSRNLDAVSSARRGSLPVPVVPLVRMAELIPRAFSAQPCGYGGTSTTDPIVPLTTMPSTSEALQYPVHPSDLSIFTQSESHALSMEDQLSLEKGLEVLLNDLTWQESMVGSDVPRAE